MILWRFFPKKQRQEVRRIELPISPFGKQASVVSEMESALSVCEKIKMTIETALQAAEAMRQNILKEAFEGKDTMSHNSPDMSAGKSQRAVHSHNINRDTNYAK